MGKLIFHEHARYVSLTATVYTVWAAYFGLVYRKFFWDFVSGILRNPGGLQPAKQDTFFIDIMVKFPVIQILSILLGLVILAVEYPAPFMKNTSAHRSLVVRVVLLLFQAFLAIMFYQVPIRPAFEKGKESGDLLFFPSQVYKHNDLGIDFEIRLCPALLHKPEPPTPRFEPAAGGAAITDDHREEKRADVFEPPYNPNLYVGDLRDEEEGTEYVVLLNKYSVVEEHFLLVTKEFQSQTSPLSPSDLVQTYLLLRAAREAGKHLFAFYNCGDRSGASQPHKHVQFLPTPTEDGPPIERLARAARIDQVDKPFALPSLPFANHVRRLTLPTSAAHAELEAVLAGAFVELLDLCISTVRHAADYPAGVPSYNVLLTLGHMYVFPRAREAHVLAGLVSVSGELGERVPVNALGFAGLLLVKSPAELDAVRREGPANVLRDVGCESVHELQVVGDLEIDGDVGSSA
ncbi:ATP adenylyltransferase-domain-containing protein [Russula dissimulans]|nr:ATP adenylyltransferase-domain-containing protein [Russula dissimulans]